MTAVSRNDLTPYDNGQGYTCWDAEWSGFTVSYERVSQDVDATEQFSALPGGGCQCPHWGYVISGSSTYIFEDREETFTAGQFFFLRPGHRPTHKAGTEWVCFSPTEAHLGTQRMTRGTAL